MTSVHGDGAEETADCSNQEERGKRRCLTITTTKRGMGREPERHNYEGREIEDAKPSRGSRLQMGTGQRMILKTRMYEH